MRINTNALIRRPAHKNYNYIQPVNDCHQCYKLLSEKTVIQKLCYFTDVEFQEYEYKEFFFKLCKKG